MDTIPRILGCIVYFYLRDIRNLNNCTPQGGAMRYIKFNQVLRIFNFVFCDEVLSVAVER